MLEFLKDDDAAHELLDNMLAENQRSQEPTIDELNVHGWTYLLIMDQYVKLANLFVHEENVVGVQIALHAHSSGKDRRGRFV